jgi:hypothetical protein
MISGTDLWYFLEGIAYDVTHLDTANIPSLLARLVAVFVGFVIAKGVISLLWRVLFVETAVPLVEGVWLLLTAPVRLPSRAVKRWRRRRQERRDAKRFAKEQAQAAAERAARLATEKAVQHESQQAELARLEAALRIE